MTPNAGEACCRRSVIAMSPTHVAATLEVNLCGVAFGTAREQPGVGALRVQAEGRGAMDGEPASRSTEAQPPRWLGLVAVIVLVLVVAGVLGKRAVDSRRTSIDPPGTTYLDVVAAPSTVGCHLAGTSLPIHVANAGGLQWYFFDTGLAPGQAYTGSLRITTVKDPDRRVVSGSDSAAFESSGIVAKGTAWAPTCE